MPEGNRRVAMTIKGKENSKLAAEIKAIRGQLLSKTTGDRPVYSVRVDLEDSDREGKEKLEDAMASHSVYTRSGY